MYVDRDDDAQMIIVSRPKVQECVCAPSVRGNAAQVSDRRKDGDRKGRLGAQEWR